MCTGCGCVVRNEGRGVVLEWVIPPTYRLGSLVGERPACTRVVPASIPGLAYSFLSRVMSPGRLHVKQRDVEDAAFAASMAEDWAAPWSARRKMDERSARVRFR